jgi:hypothetical protein
MLLARIVCSDPHCPEELEIAIADLDELDGLVCECGYGFVLMEVAELRQVGGSLVRLPKRQPARRQQAA